MEIPKLTPIVQFFTAAFALAVGGFTAGDKFGWWSTEKPILEWSPEHFKIQNTKIGDPITVQVARIKLRDDCAIESFVPTVKDASGMVHEAVPSMTKFTGPASHEVDTFMYQLTMHPKERVVPGTATLLGTITYKCPEGQRTVTYPKHRNLIFFLEP